MKNNETTETALILTIELSDRALQGTAKEIVSGLRKSSWMPCPSDIEYMEGWAYRAKLFTDFPIDTTNYDTFIASNIEAGLMKEIKREETN